MKKRNSKPELQLTWSTNTWSRDSMCWAKRKNINQATDLTLNGKLRSKLNELILNSSTRGSITHQCHGLSSRQKWKKMWRTRKNTKDALLCSTCAATVLHLKARLKSTSGALNANSDCIAALTARSSTGRRGITKSVKHYQLQVPSDTTFFN